MRVLILGGTGFVGRTIALEALARGHHVTTFNRGSKAALEGTVPITGDRLAPNGSGYANLAGLSFDAVIDTWSGDPSAVSSAVTALRGRVAHRYTYISSISVHDPPSPSPSNTLFNEDTPLYDVDKPGAETASPYAFVKRGGEIAAVEGTAAAAADGNNVTVLIVRPGVILGPHERLKNGARLPWWLRRLRRGGPTLAPCPRDLALQFVDVRDVAAFVIGGAERRLGGAFIVNGDIETTGITMECFLESVNAVTGSHSELRWMEPEAVLEAGVSPWVELPLWVPELEKRRADLYNWDVSRAIKEGFKPRPVMETIRDTWKWMEDGGPEADGPGDPLAEPVIGLDPEKEARLLRLVGVFEYSARYAAG